MRQSMQDDSFYRQQNENLWIMCRQRRQMGIKMSYTTQVIFKVGGESYGFDIRLVIHNCLKCAEHPLTPFGVHNTIYIVVSAEYKLI